MLPVKIALNDYFDASYMGTPDERYLKVLQDWGEEVVISGLEVIRDRIRVIGNNCPEQMIAGPDFRFPLGTFDLGCGHPFDSGRMTSAFLWVLHEFSAAKSEGIVIRLLMYPDYDIATLAAIILRWNEFARAPMQQPLWDSFRKRSGTAFRLASAMTLYAQGNAAPLEEIAVPTLIPSVSSLREKLTEQEKTKKREEFLATDPDPDQLEEFMLNEIGNPLSHFSSRAEKIITWDIATNGKGPKNKWPDWWVRE